MLVLDQFNTGIVSVLVVFGHLNIAKLIGYQFGFFNGGFGHIGVVMAINPIVGL
jgi:hypothetical protein